MKQFRAIVRASGMVVTTVVFADSILEAQKILRGFLTATNFKLFNALIVFSFVVNGHS